jgi:hypothetical protein
MRQPCRCSHVTQVSVSGKMVPKVVGSKKCPICHGLAHTDTCPKCDGAGIFDSKVCTKCSGHGKIGVAG